MLARVPGFLAVLTVAGRVWGPTLGVLSAFACGAVVSVLVQGATKRLVAMSRKPRAPLAALD
jgi:hypothetical protein